MLKEIRMLRFPKRLVLDPLLPPRTRLLHPNSIAVGAFPLTLLVVNVTLHFLHFNFASIAGHRAFRIAPSLAYRDRVRHATAPRHWVRSLLNATPGSRGLHFEELDGADTLPRSPGFFDRQEPYGALPERHRAWRPRTAAVVYDVLSRTAAHAATRLDELLLVRRLPTVRAV